jgi:hypothetical protein
MAENAAFPLSDVKPQVSEDCVVENVLAMIFEFNACTPAKAWVASTCIGN